MRVSVRSLPERLEMRNSRTAILSGDAGTKRRSPLPQPRVRTFLEFPRGRRAGTALHELFEAVDFSLQPIEPARQLVKEKLAQFGFEAAWQEAVLQMLQ